MFNFFSRKKEDPVIAGISVDKVTGLITETLEARVEGLAQLRALMALKIADGSVSRWCREDDQFLLAFLRARKYKMSACLDVLLSFNVFWFTNSSIIDGLDSSAVRKIYELGFMEQMRGRDAVGNAITILRMRQMDYSKFTGTEMIQLSLYITMSLFESEDIQLRGVAYVETMEGFSIMQSIRMQKFLS